MPKKLVSVTLYSKQQKELFRFEVVLKMIADCSRLGLTVEQTIAIVNFGLEK